MSIEQKLCPICGRTDCKRYGNIIIGGYITKEGESVYYDTVNNTITECELNQIGEDIYIV